MKCLPLLAIILWAGLTFAHSTQGPPIQYYDYLSSIQIDKVSTQSLYLQFIAFNQSFKILLLPNNNLFADEFISDHEFSVHPYHGDIINHSQSKIGWAAIVFENIDFKTPENSIFSGTISISSSIFHINKQHSYNLLKQPFDIHIPPSPSSHLIIYSDTPLPSSPFFLSLPLFQHSQLSKRQNGSVESIPAGCPASPKILYMGIAGDCGFVQSQGSIQSATSTILNNINSVSALFMSQFNIQFGVLNLTLLKECSVSVGDPAATGKGGNLAWNRDCDASYSLNQRLSDFSRWRGDSKGDNAGLWFLLTKCGTGSAVGIAWLGAVCQQDATLQAQGDSSQQYVSGTGVAVASTNGYRTLAHEIGHSFSAIHDCTAQNCPCSGRQCQCCGCTAQTGNCDCKGEFLMHPTDTSSTSTFSQCSQQFICSNFTRLAKCLKNPGDLPQITQNICGNGIKEGNEECDCGISDACKSDPCCNWDKCTLKSGAKCSDKNDGCCKNCQVRPAGFVCRAQNGPCDLPEICTGTNATCPTDQILKDGTACTSSDGGNICASGYCTSRDAQCKNPQFNTVAQCANTNLECQMVCTNSTGTCVQLPMNYIDGTPCGFGFGGTCQGGKCKSGSDFIDTVYNFVSKSPQIGIPIIAGVAIILLLVLIAIIRCLCCCARRRRDPTVAEKPVATATSSASGTPKPKRGLFKSRSSTKVAAEEILSDQKGSRPSNVRLNGSGSSTQHQEIPMQVYYKENYRESGDDRRPEPDEMSRFYEKDEPEERFRNRSQGRSNSRRSRKDGDGDFDEQYPERSASFGRSRRDRERREYDGGDRYYGENSRSRGERSGRSERGYERDQYAERYDVRDSEENYERYERNQGERYDESPYRRQ
ncbi:hypothetical protein HK098_001111 [Nowakowskiella sp. JEL0407]|nr:hypothetical protein HK098_001111 [Nowakowskiella sp. JEL0407]